MRFHEDQLATFTASDQQQRTIHIWNPGQPRAVLLALHGGMAHAGDYVTPALYFRDRGVATISYDLCGHARHARVDIPGFGIFLNDTALLLQWVTIHYPDTPIFLMGHSMGALIAAHLELGLFAQSQAIRGVILSSPYFVNAVKVPKIILTFASVLARLLPTAKVPMESLTPFLTHDPEILARHRADEKDAIRASEVSFRFAAALLSAQTALGGDLSAWRHPVFAALAGDDKLADAQASRTLLETIPSHLLQSHWYPDNYHENFNECNRATIFDAIDAWMKHLLASDDTAVIHRTCAPSCG